MNAPKHRIQICMGSSCFSRGNGLNAELLQRLVAEGNLDATITGAELSGTLCEGLCKDGPIIVIDGIVHRRVTATTLPDILSSHDTARI
jgi:NADH:ubiquinone oxidoreductase subunit E